MEKLTTKEISERLPEEYRKTFCKVWDQSVKENKKIRVYADGCFDMYHYGHARLFKQIKDMNPNIVLVVGVCSDEDIKAHKTESVMSEIERTESVKHCKWVDEVYFPAPWHPNIEFIDNLNIDYIAHDTIPYTVPNTEDCYLPMKETGRFLPTLRTKGVSTSDLLTRILKNREKFYQKCLGKGMSRDQINLSFPEYAFYELKGVYKSLKHLCLRDEED